MKTTSRRGITLIEMALALGVGMVVVFGAFAIVDAASKVIGAARKRALEEELVSAVVRYLRQTPVGTTPTGAVASEADISGSLFGATAGYPEDWPRVLVSRVATTMSTATAVSEIYTIRFLYSEADINGDGVPDSGSSALARPALVIPIVRLP
jgi:hypothetical protein